MSVDFKVQIRALDAGDAAAATARPEMRRVKVSGLEDLRAFVSTEFGAGAPVEMLVEYVDRDGDMIKMGPAAAEWDAMLADRAAGGSRVLTVSWKLAAKSEAGAGAPPPPRPPASRLAPRAVVPAVPAMRDDDEDDDDIGEAALDYTCAVCHEVYDDPCPLSCGHTFCRDCIAKLHNDKCPCCNKEFERAAALQARCRDAAILYYCRTVRVRCSGPGCTWSGKNEQAKRHAARCVFVLAATAPAHTGTPSVSPTQVVKASAPHVAAAPAAAPVRPPPPAYAAAAASATASRGVRDIVTRDDFNEAHTLPPPPRAAPPALVVARPAAASAPAAVRPTLATEVSGRDDATYRFSAEWGRALDAVQSHHIRASVYPKRVQILSTDFDGMATFALATPLTAAAGGRKAFRMRIDRWHSPKSFAWIGLLPTDAKPLDKAKISQLDGCGISVCPSRHMQYEGAWWYNQPAGEALHLHVPEKSEVQVTADLAYGEATVEVFLPTDLETPARRLRMALRAPLVGEDAVLPAVSLLCRGDVVDLVDASG